MLVHLRSTRDKQATKEHQGDFEKRYKIRPVRQKENKSTAVTKNAIQIKIIIKNK